MKIKKEDVQYLIIAPTIGERLLAMLVLAVFIFIFYGIYSSFNLTPWFIAAAVIMGLYALGKVVGDKIVIDRTAESITVEKRHFLLIRRRRVVSLSAVRSVVIDYKSQRESPRSLGGSWQYLTVTDAWEVSLDTGGKKFKIDDTGKKVDMLDLANRISRFIGKELIDNSKTPESSSKGVGGTDFDFPSSRPPPYSL